MKALPKPKLGVLSESRKRKREGSFMQQEEHLKTGLFCSTA